MDKRFIFLTLALTLALTFPLFAEDETFTITTYYPSPYGSYNELEVYRSVTYKPQNSTPTNNPKEGELVYVDTNPSDSIAGQFYYYGGGAWLAQGGGGMVYMPKCTWSCSAGVGCTATCDPPACAQGYTSLGIGCAGAGGAATSATSGETCTGAYATEGGCTYPCTYRADISACCCPQPGSVGGSGYGYCERYCVK